MTSKKNGLRLSTGETILSLVLAAFTAVYLELYRESIQKYLTGSDTGLLSSDLSVNVVKHLALYFLCAFIIYLLVIHFLRPLLRFIDKYRYIIAAVIFIVCILFEISGSSIAIWYQNLHGFTSTADLHSAGLLMGYPRQIRSDEFAMLTPFNLSQQYNGYAAISTIARGSATDVTTLYGAPAWALVTLFRPFYWGYLFLGSARGLSFYWVGRLLALFLISYEFGKYYTKGNKWFAGTVACILTFSPAIQWWYSTNGLCEMLIFGQAGVLLLAKYMKPQKIWKRVLIALLLVECLGGFLFTYYPAWEIPLGFVFLLLGVWVIVSNRKSLDFKPKRDLSLLGGTILVFCILVAGVLLFSKDAILTTLHTAYPGERIENGGGGYWNILISQFADIVFPVNVSVAGGNPTNISMILSFFPLGMILGVFAFFRRKKDGMIAVLFCLESLFICYFFVPFPSWLSQITLLSQSHPNRVFVPIGIIDTLLLFRSLTFLKRKEYVRPVAVPGPRALLPWIPPVLLSAAFTGLAFFFNTKTMTPFYLFLIFLAILPLMTGLFFFRTKKGEALLFVSSAVLLLLTGLTVNPVQKGISAVTEDPLITEIRETNAEDPGIWAATEAAFPNNNLPVLAGVSTVSSSQVYPDLKKWGMLDPTGQYADIYNRYSHVIINLVSDATSFRLLYPDQFLVSLNYDDMEKLNIKYILTSADYGETPSLISGNDAKMSLLATVEGYRIYKITD